MSKVHVFCIVVLFYKVLSTCGSCLLPDCSHCAYHSPPCYFTCNPYICAQTFYVCALYGPVLLNCGPAMYFDPRTNQCSESCHTWPSTLPHTVIETVTECESLDTKTLSDEGDLDDCFT